MSTVQEIEAAIVKLDENALSEFRKWYAEFDAATWDAEIERDAADGKLDAVAEEAIAAFRAGRCTPL